MNEEHQHRNPRQPAHDLREIPGHPEIMCRDDDERAEGPHEVEGGQVAACGERFANHLFLITMRKWSPMPRTTGQPEILRSRLHNRAWLRGYFSRIQVRYGGGAD